MHVYARSNAPTQDIEELHYWRKHWSLHRWLEQLYRQKGGKEPDINFLPFVLNSDDIDRLEQDIRGNRLPSVEEVFFGASDGSKADDDLAFIAKARAALAAGKTLFYVADW